MDVRFAPTEAERRHKSGALASRYANIGQGAVCQWHTFRTDRSEYEDTKYGTICKASFTPTSSYANFMSLPSITRLRAGKWMEGSFAYSGKSSIFALSANGEKLSGFWTTALFGTGTASLVAAK